MRASHLVLAAAFLQGLLAAPPASALDDGHSLAVMEEALQSPIPESAIEQARRVDDQILRSGSVNGTKVYLVTDDRLQHVQALVRRVLVAIGENPQGWVVRVLDTNPTIVNAFVNGGKYIYVFSGLLAEVHSDNELAVVIGHEIGHSMLKHNIRRNSDLTSTFANLAVLVGQFKGGSGGGNAMAIGKALHNGYSRDDEREADAFGVLAAWRAGFDPIGGAAFFTRLEQADDKASAVEAKQLDDYKAKVLMIKSQCEIERQQWAAGQIAHTQQNVDAINHNCALYTQAANSYSAAVAQRAANASQINAGDHPADQERIAAIAAETDWLHGARTLKSMADYPRAYCVIAALLKTKSPIFAGVIKTGGGKQDNEQKKPQQQVVQSSSQIPQRLQSLSDQYDACVQFVGAPECTELKQQLDAQNAQSPPPPTQARVPPAQSGASCVVRNGRFTGPGC